jgi:hypothetical protein
MESESISLKCFLLGDHPNKALSACAAAGIALLKAGADIRDVDWRELSSDIEQELEQVFDVRLIDLLASAWKDYRALGECADPIAHPANEMISLPMIDHSIETALQPCVDVIIGTRPPVRITFAITCELEFKGLVLKIQDATIRAICVGSCRAKASIKCDGITVIRRESKKLNLPGRIVLAHGIPIQAWRATGSRGEDDPWKRSPEFTGASSVTNADPASVSAMAA